MFSNQNRKEEYKLSNPQNYSKLPKYKYITYGKTKEIIVLKEQYQFGGTALVLKEYNEGSKEWEVTLIATTKLDYYTKDDEVLIKNYSENSGILEWLIINGIVSKPLAVIETGYVQIPLCKVLI